MPGTYRTRQADEFGSNPGKWPVIYLILPVTNSLRGAIRDVDLLEPFAIDAARPRQQSAAFFMGAHGLHKNRLAEAVVCVLRLDPGMWATQATYESLFPDVDSDPIYRWMLHLKQRYATGMIGRFLNEVSHFEFGVKLS